MGQYEDIIKFMFDERKTMSGVTFHFLNVGHGDCTIVYWPARDCGGKKLDERTAIVDLYHDTNRDEYEDVIQYYKDNFKDFNGNTLPVWRFICSHPHQDHICGLNELFEESGISIINFWDVSNKFEPEDFNGHSSHEDDWNKYEYIKAGSDSKITIINTLRGETRQFWDEDKITILSPSQEMIDDVHGSKQDGSKRKPHEIDIDHISFSLLIEINSTKVILGGDGKEKAWNDIYENCKTELADCHILKAAHHGHQSGFHEDSVKKMKPQHVIFSNSEDEDDNNGAFADYRRVLPDAKIFKTWRDETIIADCDFDGGIEITNSSGKRLN